ncbi:MAG: MATE family efflux transporter, partial [Halovenus sp.]
PPSGPPATGASGCGPGNWPVGGGGAGAGVPPPATGVGQNLGAETPDRAARVTWVGTGATMGFLFGAAAICIIFPETIIGVFDSSADTNAEGRQFLYIIAPFWAFFGGTMVIQGGFRGAGQTKVALALSFLARWVFRVPVAIVLAFSAVSIPGTSLVFDGGFGIGVEGVWLAFSIGAFLTFLLATFWFRLGRWTEGVIEEADRVVPEFTGSEETETEQPPVETED